MKGKERKERDRGKIAMTMAKRRVMMTMMIGMVIQIMSVLIVIKKRSFIFNLHFLEYIF